MLLDLRDFSKLIFNIFTKNFWNFVFCSVKIFEKLPFTLNWTLSWTLCSWVVDILYKSYKIKFNHEKFPFKTFFRMLFLLKPFQFNKILPKTVILVRPTSKKILIFHMSFSLKCLNALDFHFHGYFNYYTT